MKIRTVALFIMVLIGSVIAEHWRFVSDTLRPTIDTMSCCEDCDWDSIETYSPINSDHWCGCVASAGTLNTIHFREYFKEWTEHSIWAHETTCPGGAGSHGNTFWCSGCEVGKWIHVSDTIRLPAGWGSEQCKEAILCFSVPYLNEIKIRMNSHEIFSDTIAQGCPYICIKGYELGEV